MPGFILSHEGFKVDAPNSDTFFYQTPYTDYHPISTSDTGQIAALASTGQGPRRIRYDLYSSGFALQFESGFAFKLHSLQCPFITWGEGSVGAEVPTPRVSWAIISFRDMQPPIILSLPAGKQEIVVTGAPGAWVLKSVDFGPMWVQIRAPLGSRGFPTNKAAELGELARQVTSNLGYWTDSPPTLRSVDEKSDETSVVASWHFDRTGVPVPEAAILAPVGGYRVTILSKVKELDVGSSRGPVLITDQPDLIVRFPVRRFDRGRSILAASERLAAPASPAGDIPGIVALAWSNLSCSAIDEVRGSARDSSAKYISDSPDFDEPFTGQKLPFDALGHGLDVAAAQALLMQTLISTRYPVEDQNPLLLSILLRRDWLTWRVWADSDLSRRAGALTAMACLLDGSANQRLNAAMLEAGLSAERGLAIWQRHRGIGQDTPLLEPLSDLRTEVFFKTDSADQTPFLRSLISPVRLYSDLTVSSSLENGQLVLRWSDKDKSEKSMVIVCHDHFAVEKGAGLESLKTVDLENGRQVLVRASAPGPCELKITLPPNLPLPGYGQPPPYSESRS